MTMIVVEEGDGGGWWRKGDEGWTEEWKKSEV